jgi:peptide/nickel transport system ATP-binding protein
VMRKGCVVEAGPTGKVLHDPSTAYTRSLLDAIPGQEYERALASAG